ncbi:MAG: hypothetical protein IT204_09795 [Fimbriimonadaceae bacterium]|nr:hypothetical protein [Fimbriimonadaceae bacterium]
MEQALVGGARLAWRVLAGEPTTGVPAWMLHVMEHAHLERLAGRAPGDYRRQPEAVYLAAQRAAGCCLIDQWIPHNPLTMEPDGYHGHQRGATTGGAAVELDGLPIDSPEAVCEHLERFTFPRLTAAVTAFDAAATTAAAVAGEAATQALLGPDILKAGYGLLRFPTLAYGTYGYVPYLSATALYPEVIATHFRLQADLALLHNRAVVAAYQQGGWPRLHRLDHDLADSRGPLIQPRLLHEGWLPQVARALQPALAAGIRLIWHCDGNLSSLVDPLLELGLDGFQGFQYEAGMDYPAIGRRRTRDGRPLLIVAGVSVTTTLAHGTPAQVRDELRWLVEHGPRGSLLLGASSSICPGVSWDNLATLVEGLHWYRRHSA